MGVNSLPKTVTRACLIAWQSDRWSCGNQQVIAIKAVTQCSIVGDCAGISQCGWLVRSVDPVQVTAVSYQITDARRPFPRSPTLSRPTTHCCTYNYLIVFYLARSARANSKLPSCCVLLALAMSSSGNLSVSVLTISGGRVNATQRVLLLQLTHSLPTFPLSPCCVCNQPSSGSDIWYSEHRCSGVAIGLLIATSLSFDRTWLQTISNDLIAIKSWSRQALYQPQFSEALWLWKKDKHHGSFHLWINLLRADVRRVCYKVMDINVLFTLHTSLSTQSNTFPRASAHNSPHRRLVKRSDVHSAALLRGVSICILLWHRRTHTFAADIVILSLCHTTNKILSNTYNI